VDGIVSVILGVAPRYLEGTEIKGQKRARTHHWREKGEVKREKKKGMGEKGSGRNFN